MYQGKNGNHLAEETTQPRPITAELEPDQPYLPTFKPADHANEFEPLEYLNAFYREIRTEPAEMAMKLVLYSLPNFVARIPSGPHIRVIDVGSGPTIYMAAYFRRKAKEVYLTDFSDRNTNELRKWLGKDSDAWNWGNMIQSLIIQESISDSVEKVEAETRAVIKGILTCNIFDPNVIEKPELGPFDVVTTVFCIEYASEDAAEYKRAMQNLVRLVKPGGFLLICGVQGERSYHFGGKRFRCHYLEEEELFNSLRDADIDMDSITYCNHDGVFLISGQKHKTYIG